MSTKRHSVLDASSPWRQQSHNPLRHLPHRSSTKHMHERLLRSLKDRRVKRIFS
jgi:hypothetical protein